MQIVNKKEIQKNKSKHYFTGVFFLAIILCGFFAAVKSSQAATIGASSCLQVDVQAAINMASDGDIVSVPAGNCTWTTPSGCGGGISCAAVSINQKGITLQGAGAGSTIITDSTGANWDNVAIWVVGLMNKNFRIADFTFQGNGSAPEVILVRGDNKAFRIDHNEFSFADNKNDIAIEGDSYGVIDHNIFECDASETPNNYGQRAVLVSSSYGAQTYAGDTRWLDSPEFGSANAVYIEDNNFNSIYSMGQIIDSNFGARWVVRHNTLVNGVINSHGPGQALGRGTQLVEIYNNSLLATIPHWDGINLRSGTGVIFNNTISGFTQNTIDIDDPRTITNYDLQGPFPIDQNCDGTQGIDGNIGYKGYPCMDQIGRGVGAPGNQTNNYPMYEWNNTDGVNPVHFNVVNYIAADDPDMRDHIQEGRDYFNDTQKPGYTPYVYPHPLVAITDTASPMAPSGLSVT